jgi:hypothetical protein
MSDRSSPDLLKLESTSLLNDLNVGYTLASVLVRAPHRRGQTRYCAFPHSLCPPRAGLCRHPFHLHYLRKEGVRFPWRRSLSARLCSAAVLNAHSRPRPAPPTRSDVAKNLGLSWSVRFVPFSRVFRGRTYAPPPLPPPPPPIIRRLLRLRASCGASLPSPWSLEGASPRASLARTRTPP